MNPDDKIAQLQSQIEELWAYIKDAPNEKSFVGYDFHNHDGVNSQKIDANKLLNISSVAAAPTGAVMMYGKSTAPTGWLNCDGTAVSRSTYATLFGIISTNFGTGNGTTTFNVPDYRGRTIVGIGTGTGGGVSGTGIPTGGSALTARAIGAWLGEETHTLSVGELAAHTHTLSNQGNGGGIDHPFWNGASSAGTATTITSSSTGSGTAHNNIQPVVAINIIIKT